MSQNWPAIPSTQTVSSSRPDLLARDESLKSNFAGTTFPSTDLVEGMMCFRSDLDKWYGLVSIGPSVWEEIVRITSLGTAAFINTGTSGATIPLLDAANTFSGTITCSAATALNVGANTILGSTGNVSFGSTKVLVNANTGSTVQFSVNNVTKITMATDGGLVLGGATGGSQGSGTINAENIYKNGSVLGTAAFVNTGSGGTQVPTNSILGDLAYKNDIADSDVPAGTISLNKLGVQTARSIIVCDASGVPTALAPGSEGQILGIVSGAPAYLTQSQDVVKIGSYNLAGLTLQTIPWTAGIYRKIELHCENVRTSGAEIYMRVYRDAALYSSNNYHNSWMYWSENMLNTNVDQFAEIANTAWASQGYWKLCTGNSGMYHCGTVELWGILAGATYTQFKVDWATQYNGTENPTTPSSNQNARYKNNGYVNLTPTVNITGVDIARLSSGTLSGWVHVYGYK